MANFRSRRVVAAAAAALAVVGGAGAAVAASGGGSRASDFLDNVAKHLGVSPQKLKDATKAAAIDQVNADLAAGRITKAQADAEKARINAGDVPFPGGPGPGARGFGGPGGPGGPGLRGRPSLTGELAAAAKYLGLSESELRTKLRDGQSLAAVAKAQGKGVAGLEDAIVAAEKADLDKAVADKRLTQSQADDILSGLKSRVDDLVNAKPGDRPALRGRHRGGPRFFFGP